MNEPSIVDASADLHYLLGGDAPTDLVDCPGLARRAGVARVAIKAEWQRPFGNFKSLGGMLAGLRALARHCGAASLAALLSDPRPRPDLPRLICASDGNHGLAVAAAARRAGTTSTIHLPHAVGRERVARIEALGATVIRLEGTYDVAVDAARAAAARGEGLLIPDTSPDPNDVVVHDVLSGYGRIAAELIDQLPALGRWPSHVIIQAGVGGLAAAVVRGLKPHSSGRCRWIAVEPARAACVGRALDVGRPVLIDGTLETVADMLSCGLASASAIEILQSAGATAIAVDETPLRSAVDELRAHAGIESSASGAAGVAGLLDLASSDARRRAHGIDADSVILLLVTEGRVPPV